MLHTLPLQRIAKGVIDGIAYKRKGYKQKEKCESLNLHRNCFGGKYIELGINAFKKRIKRIFILFGKS